MDGKSSAMGLLLSTAMARCSGSMLVMHRSVAILLCCTNSPGLKIVGKRFKLGPLLSEVPCREKGHGVRDGGAHVGLRLMQQECSATASTSAGSRAVRKETILSR